MRRPSYLYWTETEDTYNNKDTPPNKSKQVKSSQVSSSIPSSNSPMVKHRPKVRKSTTLLKLISKRDLGFDDAELVDNTIQNKSRGSVNNLSSLAKDINDTPSGTGYASDNEEDSEQLIENQNEDENDDECNCELCGRVVPIINTSLVDSRVSPDEKIRICEVCLYETDSEDETTADESGFMDVMHNAMQSENNEQNVDIDNVLNNAKQKSKEMSDTINNLLTNLNDNNNIKEQLIKLQSDMKQLFDY